MKIADLKNLLDNTHTEKTEDLAAAMNRAETETKYWLQRVDLVKASAFVTDPEAMRRLIICVAACQYLSHLRLIRKDFDEMAATYAFRQDNFSSEIISAARDVTHDIFRPEPEGLPMVNPVYEWTMGYARDFLFHVKRRNVNTPDGSVLSHRVGVALALRIRDRFDPLNDSAIINAKLNEFYGTESMELAEEMFAHWMSEAKAGQAPDEFQHLYDAVVKANASEASVAKWDNLPAAHEISAIPNITLDDLNDPDYFDEPLKTCFDDLTDEDTAVLTRPEVLSLLNMAQTMNIPVYKIGHPNDDFTPLNKGGIFVMLNGFKSGIYYVDQSVEAWDDIAASDEGSIAILIDGLAGVSDAIQNLREASYAFQKGVAERLADIKAA